jgi:uncharacterized caspase-like protein
MNALRRHLLLATLLTPAARRGWAQPAAGKRLALVVGNADYRAQPLRNPVNDARDVAATLEAIGFRTLLGVNLGLRELVTAIQDFTVLAREHEVRLLFFAGHGMQIRGRNHLIPVDAQVRDPEDVARHSVDLADVLERLGQLRSGLNIVIVDACRNNPFNNPPAVDSDGRRIRARGLGLAAPGLAEVDAPSGTVIAFSTAPGRVAIDNGRERHSVYTKHLLANLRVPGLPIEGLFKRVRTAVMAETQDLQVPWESSSLTGEFCFSDTHAQRCGAATAVNR